LYKEVIHKGNAYPVSIPEDKFWHTFHVTKHVIEGFEEEGFGNFLDFSFDDISDNRKKQKNNFHCSIDFKIDNKKFCKMCVRMEECFELLSMVNKEYRNHIFNSIENDQKNPRNASYYDQKIYTKCLLIIDDEGLSIIAGLTGGKYTVRTSYGFDLIDANEMSLKLRALYDDSEWRRDQAIMRWEDKFQNSIFKNKKRFVDIRKHNPENWEV